MIFSLIKSKERFPIHRRDSELEILLGLGEAMKTESSEEKGTGGG